MAKRLNYEIGITADIKQFKSAVDEALAALEKLNSKSSLTEEMSQASVTAAQFGRIFESSINDKGVVNLAKFNDSLKNSGASLEDYYNAMTSLGTEGQEAFLKIASSVTSTETPLRRANTLLDSMWTTMKNTMRWQLTSSTLHSLVGTFESAYGYAKDLDESLNNIRIVSGESAEEMEKFAKQANSAAKALSTTTTDYTNAALIYYQQGKCATLGKIA